MAKLKKGDTVQILAGRDRGLRGKVAAATAGRPAPRRGAEPRDQALEAAAGPRHARARDDARRHHPRRGAGATVERGLVCPACDQVTRVGFTITDGVKTRVCKKCGKDIPS